MITKVLYIILSSILLFGFYCKQIGKSETNNNEQSDQNKTVMLNIPISKDNPVKASSTLETKTFNGNRQVNYFAANILDFKENTAWVDGSKTGGIGEWVAIYMGEGGSIKDISELEVYISSFYRNNNGNENLETDMDYLRPTKFNLELYVDTNLVASLNDEEKKDDSYEINKPLHLKSNINNLQSGIIWLKIIIVKTKITWEDYEGSKRNNHACIGNVMFNFKNDNPHSIKETISEFAKGLKEKNKTILAEFTNKPYNVVVDDFTNEFVPEEGPRCDTSTLRIHSENIAFVFAAEGGDCCELAKFEFKNGKWYFTETLYFPM
jgi:hypothetical protein